MTSPSAASRLIVNLVAKSDIAILEIETIEVSKPHTLPRENNL